jgi:hypothetical protein
MAANTVTEKSLNARSTELGKSAKSIRDDIQEHIVNIAKFINGAGNGNVTPATFLIAALGGTISSKATAVRTNAIRQWFLDFAGCGWNAQKHTFNRRKDFKFDLSAAEKNKWYEWTPEHEFKPVDAKKLLAAAIRRMKVALMDTEHAKEHVVPKAFLTDLEKFAETHGISQKDLIPSPARSAGAEKAAETRKPTGTAPEVPEVKAEKADKPVVKRVPTVKKERPVVTAH